MLGDGDAGNVFFFGRSMVDREVVADFLLHRDGELLEWFVSRHLGRPAPLLSDQSQVAIFPNRKTCRRAFDFEVQIVHDLSTLLTPQYHHADTVDYHALSLPGDVATNDLTVCVSDATRTDVLRYLSPADPSSVVTIYNAATPAVISLETDAEDLPSRPYVVILGTIEPRKNISEVLALLRDNSSFSDHLCFVFLGRFGWGTTVEELVAQYGLESHLERGAIQFPGFVSEARKVALLRNAHLLIYPSLFEGFGLPILEAMAMGVPSIITASSSMPEVGGDACFYFDPFRPHGLRNALVEALIQIDKEGEALRTRCRQQAARFSWPASYKKLRHEIAARLDGAV